MFRCAGEKGTIAIMLMISSYPCKVKRDFAQELRVPGRDVGYENDFYCRAWATPL